MGRGLYHHPAQAGARRAVSEGSGPSDRPSLRIVRTRAFLLPPSAVVLWDPPGSPHIAKFVLGPYGSGVATALTTLPSFLGPKSYPPRTAPTLWPKSGDLNC